MSPTVAPPGASLGAGRCGRPWSWRGPAVAARVSGLRDAAAFAPLAMLLAGLEGIGGATRRPGLAAAEEAHHAALDLQMVGIGRRDRGAVGLPVLGVVDLAFPGSVPGFFFMSIRIGMPSVGLFRFDASGLLLSRPPGCFSQATTPHMLPLHWATRMLATPSATRQSPVGSAARADDAKDICKNTDKIKAGFTMFRGQCNMAQTCACVDGTNGGKTPHRAFSVDEMAINRSM